MDAETLMDHCAICDGTGWLWGWEYDGFSWPTEVREGEVATPLQRCDDCERYEGDWDAAQACLAARFDGDGVVVWGVPERHSEAHWERGGVEPWEDPPLDVFVITVKENL
jgi:hypothetical protein